MANGIGFSEIPATKDGDIHEATIFGSDDVLLEKRCGFCRGNRMILDSSGKFCNVSFKRQVVDQSNAGHARKRANAVLQAAIKSDASRGIIAKGFAGRDARRKNLFGLKARIHVGQRPETSNEKARRNDEEYGKSHFSGHEETAEALRTRNRRSSAT